MRAKITVVAVALCLLFSCGAALAENQEENGLLLYRSGRLANLQGHYKKAGALLLLAIANLPENSKHRHNASYQLGLSYLALGKYEKAAGLIKAFLRFRPGHGRAWFNFGLAMLMTKRYNAAAAAFQVAGRKDPAQLAKATLYLGLARLKAGQRAAAGRAFNAVIKGFPKTSHADRARLLLSDMLILANSALEQVKRQLGAAEQAEGASPGAGKPWSMTVSMGVIYNDNVTYLPDDAVLPGDISSKDSFGITHGVSGTYEFYRANNMRAGISAGWNGTKWLDVDDFSSDSLNGGAYWKWVLAPFQLRTRLNTGRTWLDGHSNNWYWSITPGLSYQPARWTWTDLDYAFFRSEFDGQPPASGEARDSDTHWVALRQNFYFDGALLKRQITYFSAGLSWAQSDAKGDSVDNSSWGVNLSFRQGLPHGFQVMLTYGYRQADYDNPNVRSASGQTRRDDANSYGLTLFKKFSCPLTAYLSFNHGSNSSNIGNFYSYESNVVTAGVRWDF